ncbi:MAG: hypothetical protein GX606_06760, partial [Elusimicrobia bacterium]|nr:hypothetical protein [Elusimicrobiota bacterium]
MLVSFFLSCVVPPAGFAQAVAGFGVLPGPGAMVLSSPRFEGVHLAGILVHPDDPLKFDFLIDQGDSAVPEAGQSQRYRQTIKYFFAALTIPEKDQWVNLSPYEKDRIIDDRFGLTEMGRDLLAQDYLLKQLTASLIHPDTDLGREFWSRVYARAKEKLGDVEVPMSAFNKVWITPDSALVWEEAQGAFVVESRLKVLTEQDYVSLQENTGSSVFTDRAERDEVASLSSDIVREVLIPEIEREINEGRTFAPLREIYSAMILATWYKQALKRSLLGQIYADRAKVLGVDQDPANNDAIYQQYVAAFKKGVFNLIKEDVDEYSKEIIPRQYFSGGFDPDFAERVTVVRASDPEALRVAPRAQGFLGRILGRLSRVVVEASGIEQRVADLETSVQGFEERFIKEAVQKILSDTKRLMLSSDRGLLAGAVDPGIPGISPSIIEALEMIRPGADSESSMVNALLEFLKRDYWERMVRSVLKDSVSIPAVLRSRIALALSFMSTAFFLKSERAALLEGIRLGKTPQELGTISFRISLDAAESALGQFRDALDQDKPFSVGTEGLTYALPLGADVRMRVVSGGGDRAVEVAVPGFEPMFFSQAGIVGEIVQVRGEQGLVLPSVVPEFRRALGERLSVLIDQRSDAAMPYDDELQRRRPVGLDPEADDRSLARNVVDN